MADVKHINATFVKGTTAPEQFPAPQRPEVAMIGRSNVGKSSLINTIVRQGKLARVSNTPGKTQEINFFSTDQGFELVDLPGYGYAQVSKVKREQFSSLIKAYLLNRPTLALVCILVDSRHDPMQLDLAMIEEMEFAQKTFSIILTKIDKLKPKQVAQRMEQFRELLSMCKYAVDVIPSSVVTDTGRSEILGMMKRISNEFSGTLK